MRRGGSSTSHHPNARRADEHRIAIGVAANIAGLQKDYKRELDLATKGLSYDTPVDDPQSVASLQVRQAEALIGFGRAAEAKPLLETARKTYEAIPLPLRVQEIDALLAKTR